jgi:hypothetical protein
MELKEARAILKSHGATRLLADPDDNPKLAKSLKLRVLTRPLHLAPADLSGFEVCPMRTAGCTLACLHTAGNPAFMRGKARARNARTVAYFKAREAFMVALVAEIEAHEKEARAKRYRCGVRLNATSDIPWEKVPCTRNGVTFANVMLAFPKVTFYDYTKRHNRRGLPSNYSLTFSLAENNDANARAALEAGMNVAAVFNVTPKQDLPAAFTIAGAAFPVIDGDVHDYRPIDPRGVIVGLRAKGKARGDKSGFVRTIV